MREIAPPVFVAIAERCGLIGVLDDFVLNRACMSAKVLSQTFGREIAVHVNISARRLGRLDLEATVAWAVRRHGLQPGRLVLELTETGGSADVHGAAEAVGRIRASGVSVALDDCSASVNVLRQLHTLPIDVIKLDAMLLGADDGTWRAEAVCRSIMEFSRQLSLKVHRRGHRDRGAGALAAGPRLRVRAGLPLRTAAAARATRQASADQLAVVS